jgi:hypothetical protein
VIDLVFAPPPAAAEFHHGDADRARVDIRTCPASGAATSADQRRFSR